MSRALFLAIVLARALAHAHHYEVYITACEGPACGGSFPTRGSKWGTRNVPDLPLFLSKITYSSEYKPLRRDALSPVQKGMGYIDVDTQQGRALFATKGNNSYVDTYFIDINGSSGVSVPPKEPRLLIGDRSALLEPCKNATYPGGIGGCTTISTSHARWSANEVVFSFMAWTSLGDLAMAQGLAVVSSDGTGTRILTHDASVCPYGPCDGTRPPELGVSDACPSAVPGDRVLFTRSFGPYITRLAVLELRTGHVTVLDQVPLVAQSSGCPSADARGERVLYMACTPVDQCSIVEGNVSNTYGFVALSNPSVFVPSFAVPSVDSPNFEGTYATTMCAYDDNSTESFSCLGADSGHNTILKLAVDQSTGHADGEDGDSIRMCMTPECYQTHLVEEVGQVPDTVVV